MTSKKLPREEIVCFPCDTTVTRRWDDKILTAAETAGKVAREMTVALADTSVKVSDDDNERLFNSLASLEGYAASIRSQLQRSYQRTRR